ncbi:heme oxygenase 1-like [Sorex fumeus]|uniref:heme oxygenase 1-like n=1 Tax=Sorex fumeus TaxID=62283 RepID=UPI0024AC9A88|nr:heme oxygenase 1-like [Sorex fumeus]
MDLNDVNLKSQARGQEIARGFKLVMASLYHIYEALEEEIECNKDHPAFKPLYFPEELHRGPALRRTLAFWYGLDWREAMAPSPATRHYVRRLHEVGHREPELLVAHAYTRYLGDLSGGQTLRKITQKVLDLLGDSDGLA